MKRPARGVGRPGTFGGLEELSVYVKRGEPVPVDLAEWFYSAVCHFLDGDVDGGPPPRLETLLGLSAPGKANARRQWNSSGEMEHQMIWAQHFYDLGATIPQACAMALGTSESKLSLDTVVKQFRLRKLGAGVAERRAALMSTIPRNSVPGSFEVIKEPPGAYTDIRDGKAKILATIAKHGYKI